MDSSSACSSTLIVSRLCKSATFNLGMTKLKSCDAVNLMWSYPMNNLTLTIETSFTQQLQPYALNIDNRWLKDYSMPIYRIVNNQESEIKSTEDNIVQYSDSRFQIVLKFQASSTIGYYVLPFNYKVDKA